MYIMISSYKCFFPKNDQRIQVGESWLKAKLTIFSCHVLLVRSTLLGTVCKPCNKCGGWGPTRFFSTTGSNDRWPFWIHWCMEKVWNGNGYIKISHRTHVWYIYLFELLLFNGKCIGKYILVMDGTGYGRYIQIYNVQISFNVRTVLFWSISDARALSSTRSTHEQIDVIWICLDMLSSHVKGWRCGKLMSIQQIGKPALCFNQYSACFWPTIIASRKSGCSSPFPDVLLVVSGWEVHGTEDL